MKAYTKASTTRTRTRTPHFIHSYFYHLPNIYQGKSEPEYPVIDENPTFTKVVSNFNPLDYICFMNIANFWLLLGSSFGHVPQEKRLYAAFGGLYGLARGFMYVYSYSEGRLKGFYCNDYEVTRYKK